MLKNYAKFRGYPQRWNGSNYFRNHPTYSETAARSLAYARIISRWEELGSLGLVKIESEPDSDPDNSFYDTWEHISDRTRAELKRNYNETCQLVITYARASSEDKWQSADSIGGCAGYQDEASPFENCYVIDLMAAAIKLAEELSVEPVLSI